MLDKTVKMDITRDHLGLFLEYIREERVIDFNIPVSCVFYARYLIEQKFGVRMGVNAVQQLLLEEGMLTKADL